MHKKIKHIIAVSLVLSAVCGVLPASNFTLGIGSTKAYASSDDDDDDDDLYDEAYLEGIYLSDGDIDFSQTDMDYTINVGEDVKKLTVRATPEDEDDYIVEINGDSVDDDDDFEKTVSLDEGKNTITIYVESDDDHNTYELTVYRGEKTDAASSNQGTTKNTSNTAVSTTGTTGVIINKSQNFVVQSDVNKFNAWKRVDGKWKYIDGTGEFLKNQWWFDKNTGINYYINEEGFRTTGWLHKDNNWYYFNEHGEMQIGWISINKNWYYLNKSGVMKQGWLEDSSGNWYYLDNSTGEMKTGWLESSDGKWHYLDSTGKMIKGSTINGYTLDDNGVLLN